jgi:uncharacterized damage-inducible protein DinB
VKEIILKELAYNSWANERILRNIPHELVDAEVVSSFPTSRLTVYHIWDAQIIWHKRIQGIEQDGWPSSDFKGTFNEACMHFLRQSVDMEELIRNSDEAFLQKMITYKNLKGLEFTQPVWQILLHVVNHATFHRGQIVTMLRAAGLKDPLLPMDEIAFFRE